MRPLEPPASPVERGWILVETLLATALTLYLAVRLERLSVWLFLPLAFLLIGWRRPEELGLEPRFRPPGIVTHLLIVFVLFAAYAVGHIAVARLGWGAVFEPRLPRDLGWLAVHQLLAISLPEETFFRGYVQGRLNRAFGRGRSVFGATVGVGLWIQAGLFALCHLATGDWTRLRVFFFALFAGWLRERTGSIAAPVVYHAVANVWYAIVFSSLS